MRCARCSHITPVLPPAPPADMAQLSCSNGACRVVLMYPRGAGQVQCSVCGNLNDATQSNQLGHLVCTGCQITLMYAFGAQSVKCAVCNTITPVAGSAHSAAATAAAAAAAAAAHQHHQQQQALSQGSSKPAQQAVLVENPAPADESEGGGVSLAIGVKQESFATAKQ